MPLIKIKGNLVNVDHIVDIRCLAKPLKSEYDDAYVTHVIDFDVEHVKALFINWKDLPVNMQRILRPPKDGTIPAEMPPPQSWEDFDNESN